MGLFSKQDAARKPNPGTFPIGSPESRAEARRLAEAKDAGGGGWRLSAVCSAGDCTEFTPWNPPNSPWTTRTCLHYYEKGEEREAARRGDEEELRRICQKRQAAERAGEKGAR